MENNPDFVIKNGVLTKYKGPGGEVVIPEGVTAIGVDVFSAYRKNITSVTMPESVKMIHDHAFFSCRELSEVAMPGVEIIEDFAFMGCWSLARVTFPNCMKKIGKQAFQFCEELTEVTIPKRLKNMDTSVFRGCGKLKTIRIDPQNTKFSARDGVIFVRNRRGERSLCSAPAVSGDYVVPEGVKEIGDRAFQDNKTLQSIVLPDTVEKIGNGAFADCTSLKEVVFPDTLLQIDGAAFIRCTSLKSIRLPAPAAILREYTFSGCTGLTSVSIPKHVKAIRRGAFLGCTNLKKIFIPSSVTQLGPDIFFESEPDIFPECNSNTPVIYTPSGSPAEAYAKKNGIPFQNAEESTEDFTK